MIFKNSYLPGVGHNPPTNNAHGQCSVSKTTRTSVRILVKHSKMRPNFSGCILACVFFDLFLWHPMILWFWGRWGDLWICQFDGTDVFSTKIFNVTIISISGVVYVNFRTKIRWDSLDNYILHARGVQQTYDLRRLVDVQEYIHRIPNYMSRWWFHFFSFSPPLGEMIQFDEYFSDGLKPPSRCALVDKVFLPPIINFIWYSRELTQNFAH